MSRVPPTPVLVNVGTRWFRGTLRTCEVAPDGSTCSSVVSWNGVDGMQTARVPASRMRSADGRPGCPVTHQCTTCLPGEAYVARCD